MEGPCPIPRMRWLLRGRHHIPTVVLGPGDVEACHKPNETTRVEDLGGVQRPVHTVALSIENKKDYPMLSGGEALKELKGLALLPINTKLKNMVDDSIKSPSP